ncbi:MAG: hypothetical protein AB1473_00535 [Thermodesulfobacteriota bacterium]
MYSAADFNLVKPIFNKIRKYSAPHVVAACINKVRYAEEAPDRRYGQYQPWTLLLLIKWTLLYGDPQGSVQRKTFGEDQLHNLLRDLQELSDRVDGKAAQLRDESGWFFFFRKLAFQQFPFQELTYTSRFARQSLFFGNLQPDDPLREQFRVRVGIDVQDFLEVTVIVLARFFWQNQPSVTESWFGSVSNSFPENCIRVFLRELSKDFLSVRAFLEEGRAVHAPEAKYELAEMSPLKRFPLLRIDPNYYCFSPRLLYRSLEHFIYDSLREQGPQIFGDRFGKSIFEEYVGRAVRHTRLTSVTEAELQDVLGLQQKAVDYFIVDGNAHIYIDAKAVEATYIGEVTEDPEHIIQRVDSSVLKGVRQAYSLAQRLDGRTEVGPVTVGTPEERYLLIVTCKDLILGCGRDFYHYIARNELDEISRSYGNVAWIPFEHIYVISIEDFDLFVQAVRDGSIGMAECLRRAVAADATPHWDQRKLIFRWHLYEMVGDLGPPTYLDVEFGEMMERIRNRFPDV